MKPIDNNKKTNLLNVALRLIVEEGFKGLSMQGLAKAANVSPATIYIHFDGRQDLLNQLYLLIFNTANEAALQGFDPEMDFEKGMKALWQNRFNYFTRQPYHFLFLEQFINSPLVKAASEMESPVYRTAMKLFYKNALTQKQVRDLPIEVYWSVAFAPLYQLIKFHIQSGDHPIHQRKVDDDKLLACLDLITNTLKPT